MAGEREGTSDGTPADRVNKRITRFRIEKIEFFGFGGYTFDAILRKLRPHICIGIHSMMENRLFRIRGQSDRSQRYKRSGTQNRRAAADIYEKRESSKKGKRGFPLVAVKCYFLNGRPTAALSLPSLAYRLAQGEPMNRPLGCSLNSVLQLRTAPVADSISTSRGPARSARSTESHQAFLYLTAPLITPPTTHFWAKM